MGTINALLDEFNSSGITMKLHDAEVYLDKHPLPRKTVMRKSVWYRMPINDVLSVRMEAMDFVEYQIAIIRRSMENEYQTVRGGYGLRWLPQDMAREVDKWYATGADRLVYRAYLVRVVPK